MIDVLNGGKTSKISFLTRDFLFGDGVCNFYAVRRIFLLINKCGGALTPSEGLR